MVQNVVNNYVPTEGLRKNIAKLIYNYYNRPRIYFAYDNIYYEYDINSGNSHYDINTSKLTEIERYVENVDAIAFIPFTDCIIIYSGGRASCFKYGRQPVILCDNGEIKKLKRTSRYQFIAIIILIILLILLVLK